MLFLKRAGVQEEQTKCDKFISVTTTTTTLQECHVKSLNDLTCPADTNTYMCIAAQTKADISLARSLHSKKTWQKKKEYNAPSDPAHTCLPVSACGGCAVSQGGETRGRRRRRRRCCCSDSLSLSRCALSHHPPPKLPLSYALALSRLSTRSLNSLSFSLCKQKWKNLIKKTTAKSNSALNLKL